MEAMWFNALAQGAQPMGRVRAAYRLGVNEFNGLKRPQITFENVEPA
jgi:hypothetical protein